MKCSKCGKEILNIQTASCISGYDENGKHENWLCEKCSFEWDKEHPCCPIDYVKKSISNFVCKKCGSTAYEIKDKANGTGIAHGLYCAKCGFWHKWLGKEELKQYATKESKDEIIAKLQAENAALRERLEKAVELPCRVGDKLYEIIEGEVQGKRVENYRIDNMGIWVTVQLKFGTSTILLNEARKIFLTREAAEARLKELGGRR